MSTDIFSARGGVDQQSTDERARAAVKAFRRLQPTLTSYARAYTGNPTLRVEMSADSNGATDGKKIWMRPPIGLGDNSPHDRALCDKRNNFLQQLCLACKTREEVLIAIYHEIGHNAHGSFDKVSEEDRSRLLQSALSVSDKKFARAIERKIQRAPSWQTETYMGMSRLISPFLPGIINALDDARVNAEVMKVRKGTKVMFEADAYNIFNNGVEQKDKTGKIVIVKWSEYPLNAQMAVALYCKASGLNISDWFAPKVVEATEDSQVKALLRKFPNVRSVASVYQLSIPLFVRLRELGFFQSDTDPESEPEEDEEKNEESEPTDESNDEDQEAEADGDSPGETDGDEESPSGGADSESRESDDDSEVSSDPCAESSEENEDGTESEGDSDGGSEERDDADQPDNGGNGSHEGDGDDSSDNDSTGSDGASDRLQDDLGTDSSDSRSDDDDDEGDRRGAGESIEREELDSIPDGPGLDEEEDESESDDDSHSQEQDKAGLDDGEPIDSGADEGLGGTSVIEDEANDDLPMGDPLEVEAAIEVFAHPEERPSTVQEAKGSKEEMDRAIIQGMYFETPSRNIFGVREHRFGAPVIVDGYNTSTAWEGEFYASVGIDRKSLGIDGDFSCDERTLGPALLQMRVVFADNRRGKDMRHKKSGKIDAKVLGKRAHLHDERLFRHRIMPGKKSYFVLIGIDVSGSTIGVNIALAKRAAMAQAELCARMGITFAIYAHSGKEHAPGSGRWAGSDLDIYLVKEPDEPWTTAIRERLEKLGPDSSNIDGHTLEYYRKVLDSRSETDRVILYYTDGKMPAENYDEELEILQREIKICRRKNYTLLGVGIRTDSPVRHGLDTVQVNGDEDIIKVVKHLEKALLTI